MSYWACTCRTVSYALNTGSVFAVLVNEHKTVLLTSLHAFRCFVPQLLADFCRVVSKPDLVSVYEEQWSSKWIPKLLVLARRSKSTIVQKALLDIENVSIWMMHQVRSDN